MFCWSRQWQISSALDDGRELSPGLSRHVERCPHCRVFLKNAEQLSEVLHGDAGLVSDPPIPVASPHTWGRLALAAAAVLIATAGLWLWLGLKTPDTPPIAKTPDTPDVPSPQKEPTPSLTLPVDLMNESLAKLQEIPMDPVRRELAGLSIDAESAAGNLLSYLPRR